MIQRTISPEEAGQRLDKYLARLLDKAPKSFLYRSLRKKNIKLNGKKAEGSELLRAGDELSLYFSDAVLETLTDRLRPGGIPQNRAPGTKGKPAFPGGKSLEDYCRILYEDGHIIIASKRAGVLSQKASASDFSVNEALLCYVTEKLNAAKGSCGADAAAGPAELFTPSVCNRLDRNTSGLICFAKTYAAARELNRLFRDRDLGKYYLALVRGKVTEAGILRGELQKDGEANRVTVTSASPNGGCPEAVPSEVSDAGKQAGRAGEKSHVIETRFRPLGPGCDPDTTLLEVELVTGKTHQIRAHMASVGHPLLGDPKYGGTTDKTGAPRRQMLHSWRLEFPGDTGEPLSSLSGKVFYAPVPGDMQEQAGPVIRDLQHSGESGTEGRR